MSRSSSSIRDEEDKGSRRDVNQSQNKCHVKSRLSSTISPERAKKSSGHTSTNHRRHFVKHNYHDHAKDREEPYITELQSTKPKQDELSPRAVEGFNVPDYDEGKAVKPKVRGGVTVPFPLKLHEMLTSVEKEGFSQIVSWQPHGRAFLVHKAKDFVDFVMPRYFKQSKITSFQRQLNLYGFSRLTHGPDAGAYYHELFLRGKRFLCTSMVRTKVKGTGCKAASSPHTEPDFYRMPSLSFTTFPKAGDSSGNEAKELDDDSQEAGTDSTSRMHVISPASSSDTDVFESLPLEAYGNSTETKANVEYEDDSQSVAVDEEMDSYHFQASQNKTKTCMAAIEANECHYLDSFELPLAQHDFYSSRFSRTVLNDSTTMDNILLCDSFLCDFNAGAIDFDNDGDLGKILEEICDRS